MKRYHTTVSDASIAKYLTPIPLIQKQSVKKSKALLLKTVANYFYHTLDRDFCCFYLCEIILSYLTCPYQPVGKIKNEQPDVDS